MEHGRYFEYQYIYMPWKNVLAGFYCGHFGGKYGKRVMKHDVKLELNTRNQCHLERKSRAAREPRQLLGYFSIGLQARQWL